MNRILLAALLFTIMACEDPVVYKPDPDLYGNWYATSTTGIISMEADAEKIEIIIRYESWYSTYNWGVEDGQIVIPDVDYKNTSGGVIPIQANPVLWPYEIVNDSLIRLTIFANSDPDKAQWREYRRVGK